MANTIYPAFRSRLLSPGADLINGKLGGDTPAAAPLKAILVDAGPGKYVVSAAHTHLSNVGSYTIGSAVALEAITVVAGALDADNVVFSAVAEGQTVGAVILFQDTGVAASSPLVAYFDTLMGQAPLSIATNGGNITIRWDDGPNKVFAI